MLRIVTLAILLVVAAAAPLLVNQNDPTVIPGSYIVVLKDGLGIVERDAHIAALRDHITATNAEDSEVTSIYGIGTFMGYAARMNKKLLAEQLTHPDIKYIEANAVATINYIQEPHVNAPYESITQTGATWGISRVSQRVWTANTTYFYNTTGGNEVDVYVIDTGIYTAHQDFGSRATAAFNAITNEANTDLNGHGTHCAGTIGGARYGVAKNVNLIAVKVLNSGGSGTWDQVISGINYVTNNKNGSRPAIASMSLGGGKMQTVNDAVTASIVANVAYAIAAGNSNADTCTFSPASTPNCVAVGATTYSTAANGAVTDTRSSFSNYGPCTNIFAPGQSITSDWIGSSTATNTISGTSMATPHVAGVIALLVSGNPLTPAAVSTWLASTATPNIVASPGTGSPNLFLFSDPDVASKYSK